jgi:hypothetical protein
MSSEAAPTSTPFARSLGNRRLRVELDSVSEPSYGAGHQHAGKPMPSHAA